MEILIIIYMAIASRASGGGFWAHKLNKRGAIDDDGQDLGGIMPINLTWLPEVLFALPFGFAAGFISHSAGFGIISAIWSYLWMQSPNANALHWGEGDYNPDRDAAFSPAVNWLADRFKIDRSSRNYCRIYMAVKGFLIGLPVGGLPLAILWPLGYDIGHRFKDKVPDSNIIREMLAGAGAGLAILIFWEILK